MPTVEERYATATAYVRRAIAAVEDHGIRYAVDPVTGLVEWYAGSVKTDLPRAELERIAARWLRATRDDDRSQIARDAELLADRVEESLPGAPQDRPRTNLYPGEAARGTPSSSYYGEAADQAGETWGWVKDRASSAAAGASGIGNLLLVGGGVVVGWKLFDYLRERDRRRLNASLESAADART